MIKSKENSIQKITLCKNQIVNNNGNLSIVISDHLYFSKLKYNNVFVKNKIIMSYISIKVKKIKFR